MNWHQMSFLAHFWLFLGQFGHSGSPAWARMTVPSGSTHTKNTFKCPRHLQRQKRSQKTNYFRSKPRLAKNWLKTWLKLAKNATDQKTDLTCQTGSLCHFQKWSYFLFQSKNLVGHPSGPYCLYLLCPLSESLLNFVAKISKKIVGSLLQDLRFYSRCYL